MTAALVIAAVACGPAHARIVHTVLEDDGLSLFSPTKLPRFLSTLKWLGVDELRISAEWKLQAPNPNARRAPRFDAVDPRSYDGAAGTKLLDDAVRAAAGRGIGVILDPAFSAPRWATTNARPTLIGSDPWFNENINVRELAAWETMLAERYSGRYIPAGETTPLPRVQTFTLWNEPNENGFLAPQWQDGQPHSPNWYRALTELAYPAIKRVSPGATVLVGDTSAIGADQQAGRGGVPPLTFIRQLACVDAALQPITTGSCANFTTVPGDGWSQHPYERNAPPWIPSPANKSNDAQMGDLATLQTLLDQLVAMHRLAPGIANLWLTEQGYQSNGQLTREPWTETAQAGLDAIAEYEAWRDPQLQSFSQFLLRDTLVSETVALRNRTANPHAWIGGTWSTGLERQDGTPKPALAMFRAPVVGRLVSFGPGASWLASSPAGAPAELIEVWGRARPITAPTPVIVQVSDDGAGGWRPVTETVTDANGIFDVHVGVNSLVPVRVRFTWLDRTGSWQTSPANAVGLIPTLQAQR